MFFFIVLAQGVPQSCSLSVKCVLVMITCPDLAVHAFVCVYICMRVYTICKKNLTVIAPIIIFSRQFKRCT